MTLASLQPGLDDVSIRRTQHWFSTPLLIDQHTHPTATYWLPCTASFKNPDSGFQRANFFLPICAGLNHWSPA